MIMGDENENEAPSRQFSNETIMYWAVGIFLIMLVLALFIGSTNAGEPILPLLIGDWFFKAILFVIISSIYGLQYWVKK
jgi:ABC-type microcin C transport system permease subunit YejE